MTGPIPDSTVEFYPDDDGMATMHVHGPAETVRPIFDILDRCARSAKAAGARTHLAMLRLDALAGIALGDKRANVVTEFRVTIPASSLAGMSTTPGEAHGYGTLTNDVVHKLAAGPNAFWRRLVTDPITGTVMDVGPRRRHTAPIGEFVKTRDRWCVPVMHPPRRVLPGGSHHRPRHGRIHHRHQPRSLCQHHNLLKLDDGWTLAQPRSGHVVWTAPTGHTFTVHPTPLTA